MGYRLFTVALIKGNGRVTFNGIKIKGEEIPKYIDDIRKSFGKERSKDLVVCLSVENSVKMGLVTDVKQTLREADIRKVTYTHFSKKHKFYR